MAKSGRGRSKKTVPDASSPEFFKIFLPQQSSQQLRIPPDFIKDFNRTIQEKIILKNFDGGIWHVDVERSRHGVFFKNGWQHFVSHHCLNMGELLVFRYVGKYSFVVKIFSINGCKKKIFAAQKIATNVKTEEKDEEEIEFMQTSCKHSCRQKEDTSSRACKRPRLSRGAKEVKKLEPQNVASELAENCRNVESVGPYTSNPPCFVSSFCPHKPYSLHIPRRVIIRHDLHFKPEMVLRIANGKEWPVRVSDTSDGRTYIGKGWLAFWKQNDIGLKDKFSFTFNTKRQLGRIIDVKILRQKTEDVLRKRRHL